MTDDTTIDPFTGEALLLGHGRVDGDPLSDLLDALGSAPLPSETAGGVSTIGGMVANVSVAVAARAPSSRRRLTTRVGALAVAGSMFLTLLRTDIGANGRFFKRCLRETTPLAHSLQRTS